MNNTRIAWIDTAKFIGIFFIIFLHIMWPIGIGACYIKSLLLLTIVQLFFILSGYTYKHKSKIENYNKAIWSLLVPFLIYQLIFSILVFGRYSLIEHEKFIIALFKSLAGIFVVANEINNSDWFYNLCVPCWFIMSLFQIRLLLVFINPTKKNLIILSLLFMVILKYLINYKINLLFCLDNTLLAFPFFAFGYLIKSQFPNLKHNITNNIKNYLISFLICSVSLGLLILILKYNGFARMSDVIIGFDNLKSILLYYVAGIIGATCVIRLCRHISMLNCFVATISQNTLFIIFYHWFLLFFIKWSKILRMPIFVNCNFYTKLLCCIALSFAILWISYKTILLLEKYPLILGKYKYNKLGDK